MEKQLLKLKESNLSMIMATHVAIQVTVGGPWNTNFANGTLFNIKINSNLHTR